MDRNTYDIDWRTHGNRYYDPEVGRYLTRDPIGYGDGMNVYHHVHNNPVNFCDPLGLNSTLSVDEDKKEITLDVPITVAFRDKNRKLVAGDDDLKARAASLIDHMADAWSGHYGEYTFRVSARIEYFNPEAGGPLNAIADSHVFTFTTGYDERLPAGVSHSGRDHRDGDGGPRRIDTPLAVDSGQSWLSMEIDPQEYTQRLLEAGRDRLVDNRMYRTGYVAVHEFGHVLGYHDEYNTADHSYNSRYPADSVMNGRQKQDRLVRIYPHQIAAIVQSSTRCDSAWLQVRDSQPDWRRMIPNRTQRGGKVVGLDVKPWY